MTKKYIHPKNSLWTAEAYDKPGYFYKVYETVLDRQKTLIEHITPDGLKMMGFIEAPTDTEEKGDWIEKAYNSYLEDPMVLYVPVDRIDKARFFVAIKRHMPKPVEQELVPLDVERIVKEIGNKIGLSLGDRQAIITILSKYGVPTQQPVIDWENPIVSIDHGKGIEDQTCRVVSVKDDKGKTYVIDICQYSELAEKQFFTPDYVNDRVEDNSERIQPLGEKSIIKMFLRDNGLIEE